MSAGHSLTAAACFAYAAFALAIGVGIPRWLDWPSNAVPADATDIAVLIFFGVWNICWSVRP